MNNPSLRIPIISVLLGSGLAFCTFLIVVQFERYENVRIFQSRATALHQSVSNAASDILDVVQRPNQAPLSIKNLLLVNPNPSKEEFDRLGKFLIRDHPEIRSVTLIPKNVISMIYPSEGNEGAIGMNVLEHPVQQSDAKEAIASRKPHFSGPIELKQGGEGFVIRVPVYLAEPDGNDESYWGLVSVVIDRDSLCDEMRKFCPAGINMLVSKRIMSERTIKHQVIFGDEAILSAEPEIVDLKINESNIWRFYGVPIAGKEQYFAIDSNFGWLKYAMPIAAGILFGWSASSLMRWKFVSDLLKVSNEELTQTSKRLDLALTGANVGLWDWDVLNHTVYFSETAKTQLGYPPDEDWHEFDDWEKRVHPDDLENAKKLVEDYFYGRSEEYRSIFRLRCADDSYRWILSLGNAQFDEDRKPERLIGVHVDIDDRVRADEERIERQKELEKLAEELRQANEALEQSNVELQQFAYIASHDLQTPLRGIAGFAQCLKEEYFEQMDDQGREYIDMVVTGAQRMKQLINDLLAYSRVESKASRFEKTDLNEIVDDAIGLLRISIAESDASISRGDLPEITVDASQISQLLQNLISNAIKYCGDDPPDIRISAEVNDESTIISVADNGLGIDPKHHKRIFEIFRRLHTLQKYPGTGIGLAVCRRIATRHGGEIWVESELGKGSTFHISLPHQSPSAVDNNA